MQRRNFRFLSMALAGALALGTAACGDEVVIPQTPPNITVTPASITLNVGETATVVANVTNLEGATFTFANSDQTVASVTASGASATIKALKAGTTTITVTGTARGQTVTAAVQVRVNEGPAAPKATISLTPTTASINVGQQLPLVAIVQNAANPALTWTSSAAGVATVDANGVVTGVAQGTALVTAKLNADTTVKAVASITVSPVGGNAAIAIGSLTRLTTNIPVNPANVFGPVNLTMNVTPGSSDSLRVFVGNEVISSCSRNFAGTTNSNQVVTCVINTNELDANGAPRFPNGQYQISARLFDNDQVAATATSEQLTFANQSGILTTLTTATSAINPTTGMLWNGGDVTVTAQPAIFSGGAVKSVRIQGNGVDTTLTAQTNGVFTVTFPKKKFDNVTDSSFEFWVTGVTEAGQPFANGNQFWTDEVRYDNQAPTFGTFGLAAPSTFNWINGSYKLSAGKKDQADAGVQGITVTYAYAPNTGTNQGLVGTQANLAKLFAAGTPATTGADIPASDVNTSYIVVAKVTDALGNTVYGALSANGTNTLGVDVEAPEIILDEDVNPANLTAVAAADTYVFQAADDRSGFGATPYRVTQMRRTPTANTCVIGNTADGGCAPVASNGTIGFAGTNGYYELTVSVRDQAGNESEKVVRVNLVDNTAPQVSNITIPFTLTGGAQTTFTALGQDNIDLASAQARLVFANGLELPFNKPSTYGTFGFDAFTTNVTLSETIPLITSVYEFGSNATIVGNAKEATDVRFLVADLADNTSIQTNAFAVNTITPKAMANLGNADFDMVAPAATVCTATGSSATDAKCKSGANAVTSRTLTATITGPSGTFANPFKTVYFYRYDDTGDVQLIGTASAKVADTGATRTWTYTTTFSAAGLPTQAGVEIFALGVDASGNGLLTDINTTLSIIE